MIRGTLDVTGHPMFFCGNGHTHASHSAASECEMFTNRYNLWKLNVEGRGDKVIARDGVLFQEPA